MRHPLLALALAFTVALLGVAAAGYALSRSVALTDRNCQRIEILKELRRLDLTEQIAASENFLRENPEGIHGIPPALIREGIARNARARLRLAPEPC